MPTPSPTELVGIYANLGEELVKLVHASGLKPPRKKRRKAKATRKRTPKAVKPIKAKAKPAPAPSAAALAEAV